MDLVNNKILDAVVESLSIEELEAILAQKKRANFDVGDLPKPMSERERLKQHYLKVLVSMGAIYPPSMQTVEGSNLSAVTLNNKHLH